MAIEARFRTSPRVPAFAENPVRSRVNAWFFHLMDGYMHWKYSELKARYFGDLPGTIVEIGAGTGANLRYFRPGTRVVAVEPNPHMHPMLAERAARHGLDLDILGDGAESLALPDASVDAVVASLVLCTVRDPVAAVREVRRVLRPGGRFVCIEHVAAPAGSVIGRIQRAVYRPWRWFFEGCHSHRDTERVLRGTGFSEVSVERFTWPSVFVPVRPQIAAVCVK
jgi:ubiquinone/menaquinone biosynthesis C-methylase UbiE